MQLVPPRNTPWTVLENVGTLADLMEVSTTWSDMLGLQSPELHTHPRGWASPFWPWTPSWDGKDACLRWPSGLKSYICSSINICIRNTFINLPSRNNFPFPLSLLSPLFTSSMFQTSTKAIFVRPMPIFQIWNYLNVHISPTHHWFPTLFFKSFSSVFLSLLISLSLLSRIISP